MAEINDNLVAMIAREMAMAIRPASEILGTNNLTQEEFETNIQPLDFYKRCYEAFIAEWNSIGNTNRRIAMQSAVALEVVLPLLAARMGHRGELLPDVTKTAELFGKLAGIDNEAKKTGNDRIKITINLGADTRVFEESVKAIEATPLLEKPKDEVSA